MANAEKRQYERITYDIPDMVYVEFKLGNGQAEDKLYHLEVMNCSEHGIGIIVRDTDYELIEKIQVGDQIQDMFFYSTWTLIKVNGTVRHITEINDDEGRVCYILGIESLDLIENCRPVKI